MAFSFKHEVKLSLLHSIWFNGIHSAGDPQLDQDCTLDTIYTNSKRKQTTIQSLNLSNPYVLLNLGKELNF
jgi:hypothetical protein